MDTKLANCRLSVTYIDVINTQNLLLFGKYNDRLQVKVNELIGFSKKEGILAMREDTAIPIILSSTCQPQRTRAGAFYASQGITNRQKNGRLSLDKCSRLREARINAFPSISCCWNHTSAVAKSSKSPGWPD